MKTIHRNSTFAVLTLTMLLSVALAPARAAEPASDADYAASTIGAQGRSALAALNGQIQETLPGRQAALAGVQAALDGYRPTRLAAGADCHRAGGTGVLLRRGIRVNAARLP